MTRVKLPSSDEVRVILCLAFETRASLEERQVFERFAIGRSEVLHALEAEGHFDFLLEAKFNGMPDFHGFMETLSARFSAIIYKSKVSFVCRRFIADSDHSIWVRQNGMRRRVDLNHLERVTAEGDYVRLYADGQDYLHHATMRAIEASLDPDRYVRIHRSAIVRLASIDRIGHGPEGWTADCTDGSRHKIAKSAVEHVLEMVENRSASQGRMSSSVVG